MKHIDISLYSRKLLWFCCLLGCSWQATAQDSTTSRFRFLLEPFPVDSSEKTSMTLSLDSRKLTDFKPGTQTVSVYGFNIGVVINPHRHEIVLGYNWFTTRRFASAFDIKNFTDVTARYYNLGWWQSFYNAKRVTLYVPIEIGYGANNYQPKTFWQNLRVWNQDNHFLTVQGGLAARLRLARYVGVTLKAGYFLVIPPYGMSAPIPSSPYYLTSIYISPYAVYHDVRTLIKRKRSRT